MRLLENNTIELTDTEWIEIRNQLSQYEREAFIALSWGGNFERIGKLRFKSGPDAMMFFLRWS